jgi:hypothetical protein
VDSSPGGESLLLAPARVGSFQKLSDLLVEHPLRAGGCRRDNLDRGRLKGAVGFMLIPSGATWERSWIRPCRARKGVGCTAISRRLEGRAVPRESGSPIQSARHAKDSEFLEF